GPVAVRTRLAEARDAHEDEARVECCEHFVAKAPGLERAGTEVLDEDVGAPREAPHRLDAERRAQVRGHETLIAVQHLVVEAGVAAAVSPGAQPVAALGMLDLHDLGAIVGEQHADGRAGDQGGKLHDAHAGERPLAPAGGRVFRIRNAVHHAAHRTIVPGVSPRRTLARPDTHRATARVLDVLEHLGATGETATLASLSARLGAPKTSLLPLLRTLVARRWIEQPQPACYRIAAEFPGKWSPARLELPQMARPRLARLTAATRESTFLGVLPPGDDAVVYIEKVESPERLRYSAELGERRPLHCTAIGMAVLAFLPEPSRKAVLRRLKLPPHTAGTTTERAALERRLAKVVKSG